MGAVSEVSLFENSPSVWISLQQREVHTISVFPLPKHRAGNKGLHEQSQMSLQRWHFCVPVSFLTGIYSGRSRSDLRSLIDVFC